MLSFMRDDEIKDSQPEGQNVPVGGAGFENEQNGAEQDYLVVAKHGRNLRNSTIMLAIVFSIGALCLLFMIKKTAPKTASAATDEETRIENAIAQLTGIRTEMHSRMDDIVDKFYQFSDVEQIDVSQLKKNPFRRDLLSDDAGAGPGVKFDIDREFLRAELEAKSRDLRLWSIMESPQGSCCMIDDKILYEGDSIEDFKVTRIGSGFVELSSGGIQVILKMSE